jgi:hypothetical protein
VPKAGRSRIRSRRQFSGVRGSAVGSARPPQRRRRDCASKRPNVYAGMIRDEIMVSATLPPCTGIRSRRPSASTPQPHVKDDQREYDGDREDNEKRYEQSHNITSPRRCRTMPLMDSNEQDAE